MRIQGCFAALVKRVSLKLSTMDIDMHGFRLYVSTLFPPGDFVFKNDTIMEIFSAITHNRLWDHFYYSPVEQICKEFGWEDLEVRGWINRYKAELAGFKATTKIIDYIKECNDEDEIADSEQSIHLYKARYDKKYCRKLTVKLKVPVTEKSLDYIDEFWRSIADLFLLPSLPVLLEKIREGSTEVTWFISAIAASQIESAILNADSVRLFQRFEVMQIILNSRIVYTANQDDMISLLWTELLETKEQLKVRKQEQLNACQ